MKITAPLPRHFLAALASLALTGCASSGFSSSWYDATSRFATPPAGIEGAWIGSWISKGSGHSGNLRCIVTKTPGDGNLYDFHYWATWGKALSGEYQITCKVTRVGNEYHLVGDKDLGKAFGGLYSHTGVMTSSKFNSTYQSEIDSGSFSMTRP